MTARLAQNKAICEIWRGFNSSVAYQSGMTSTTGTSTWGCDQNDNPLTPYCDAGGSLANNWVGITCGDFDASTGLVNISSAHSVCNNILLIELNAMGAALQGTISSYIGSLIYLHTLSITSSPLNGSIPSTIGNLRYLNELNIFDTIAYPDISKGISHSIPSSIDQLVNLKYLRLNDNSLVHEIPSTICHMQSILDFDLRNNFLEGNVPPCMCALTNMVSLLLNYNTFHCYPDCVLNAPAYGSVTPLALPSDVIPTDCPFCQNNVTYAQITGALLSSSYAVKTLDEVTHYCSRNNYNFFFYIILSCFSCTYFVSLDYSIPCSIFFSFISPRERTLCANFPPNKICIRSPLKGAFDCPFLLPNELPFTSSFKGAFDCPFLLPNELPFTSSFKGAFDCPFLLPNELPFTSSKGNIDRVHSLNYRIR